MMPIGVKCVAGADSPSQQMPAKLKQNYGESSNKRPNTGELATGWQVEAEHGEPT